MIAERVMGQVKEERWTCIGHEYEDADGNLVTDHEAIGRVTIERRAYFAFKQEAESWIAEQEAHGFTRRSLCSAATWYHGPTDAPGNCWVASVERDAL